MEDRLPNVPSPFLCGVKMIKANDLIFIPHDYSTAFVWGMDGAKPIASGYAGKRAIVVASYAEQFGGDNHNSFTLFFQLRGEVSWFSAGNLELIKPDQGALLQQWRNELDAENALKSDLDWIFANGPDVIENGYGVSIQALANCFGLTDLWGSKGEGIDWIMNARQTLNLAEPFLKTGDKYGWLNRAQELIAVPMPEDGSINEPTLIVEKRKI